MRNEHRLQEIIQQQRLQLFFASRLWLEARAENARLRAIITEAGLSYEPPPPDPEQLVLPLEESAQAAG